VETLGVVITGVYFSKTISVKITPVVETVKLVQAWYSSHPVSLFKFSFHYRFFPGKRKPELVIRKNKWLQRTKGKALLIYRFFTCIFYDY